MCMASVRRGRCPRCQGRSIHHFVPGFPDLESLVDEAGDLLPWVHLTGCVMDPGPFVDRQCEDCGLRWTSGPGVRVIVSTWRQLRELIGVASNREANDWLDQQVPTSSFVAPFPALDDPHGDLVIRHGAVRKRLRFPFTLAEWQSLLIGLVEDSMHLHGNRLEPGDRTLRG